MSEFTINIPDKTYVYRLTLINESLYTYTFLCMAYHREYRSLFELRYLDKVLSGSDFTIDYCYVTLVKSCLPQLIELFYKKAKELEQAVYQVTENLSVELEGINLTEKTQNAIELK